MLSLMEPLVSIIIPTKNSAKTISQTLTTVKNQTYKNIEIVLIDNHSKDSTLKIGKKFGCKTFLKGPERSTQINYGFKKSKGYFIYRIDDDFLLDKDLIKKAVALSLKNKYDALVIPNISVGETFWQKVRVLERDCYYNDKFVVGARFFNRITFKAIKGYDESLIACEDYDIHNRLLQKNYKIGFLKDYFERHIGEARTLKEIFKKNYYYGQSLYKYISKHKKRAAAQFIPIRTAYIKNIFKLLKKPHLLIGLIILKSVQYFAAILGLFNYIILIKKKTKLIKK